MTWFVCRTELTIFESEFGTWVRVTALDSLGHFFMLARNNTLDHMMRFGVGRLRARKRPGSVGGNQEK